MSTLYYLAPPITIDQLPRFAKNFAGQKMCSQKLVISKYSFSSKYIVLVDQLDKMSPNQISFAAVEEKHGYIALLYFLHWLQKCCISFVSAMMPEKSLLEDIKAGLCLNVDCLSLGALGGPRASIF